MYPQNIQISMQEVFKNYSNESIEVNESKDTLIYHPPLLENCQQKQ